MDRKDVMSVLEELSGIFTSLPDYGIGKQAKIQCSLYIMNVLEDVLFNMDNNPFPRVVETLQTQIAFLKSNSDLAPLMIDQATSDILEKDLAQQTKILFEEAWTVYDKDTYEHSVQLIRDRLTASGFDADFFKGKTCFDGGCGTGRFALAMAELGAEKVVGVDMGGESLDFARERAKEYGLSTVEFIEYDVTLLDKWEDQSFDFVVSNGVLHHSVETERGLQEHFRITKIGGDFWIYLYGDGGFYWEVYDQLKQMSSGISVEDTKNILRGFGLKQGTVYTFLDNIRAPIRKYYYTDQIVEMLKKQGPLSYKNLKGNSPIDDTEKVMASTYGREIFGPQGEVRILITRER
ncbi:MAG: class I SAM-dependent methyltransferase [Bdellovibrionota bacterium]